MSQIQTVPSVPASAELDGGRFAAAPAPTLALPETFSVETATLGRQPNNDGDNSGAMWFE
ncbi:hypothetical protein ACIQGT_25360 [Streptomyces sp. NPDC093108]|uniref:hypothetical protein n=1 Tax=Streptomyces sp. NPDC093108 TaxID=3366030 RepID=UPI00380ABFBD